MKTLRSFMPLVAVVVALLLLAATPAHAQMSTSALSDAVLQKFQTATNHWQPVILGAATSLFWKLALISLAWTFGVLLVRGAELGEITAELVRYIVFTGFWFWILQNGPAFFQAIVRSLWQLGGQASGAAQGLSVSQILDLSLQIYHMDAGQMNLLNMGNSMLACFMGVITLGLGTVMAANVILVLCSAWVMAYGGAIVLGFAGSTITRDYAIGYLRAAVAIGLQLMTLALVIGLGISFLRDVIVQAGTVPNIGDLGLLTVAMGILTIIAARLPGMVASIVSGGSHAGHGLGALSLTMVLGALWTAIQAAGRQGNGNGNGALALQQAIQAAQATIANGNAQGGGPAAGGANPSPNGNVPPRPQGTGNNATAVNNPRSAKVGP